MTQKRGRPVTHSSQKRGSTAGSLAPLQSVGPRLIVVEATVSITCGPLQGMRDDSRFSRILTTRGCTVPDHMTVW
jgi:hypothetical protein